MQWSWVITRERTFLQAGRNRVFRIRLTQTGQHQLAADTRSDTRAEQWQRIIPIEVTAPSGEEAAPGVEALAQTDPPADAEGTVTLPATRELLRITPLQEDLQSLSLDLDITRDSDGDGDAQNDNDAAGTFFASQGTALFVWFPAATFERTLLVQAVLPSGETASQMIVLRSAAAAPVEEETVPVGSEDIVMEQRGRGIVAFSVRPEAIESISAPLLFQWDFGDGQQSLLGQPSHRYPEAGTYRVLVRLQNLETGEEMGRLEAEVVIEEAAFPAEEKTEAPAEEQQAAEKPLPIGLIVKIIVVFLLAAIAGAALSLLFAKSRGKVSLQKVLESAEAKLVKKPTVPEVSEAAPPMALPVTAEEVPLLEEKGAAPETPSAAPEHAWLTEEERRTALTVEETKAPSWLAQGIRDAEERGIKPATPAPPVLQAPPPATAPPSPPGQPPPPPAEANPPSAEAEPPAPPSIEETAPLPPPEDAAEAPPLEPTTEAKPLSPEEIARQEKERERRREKRKRYRENVRKRKEGEATEEVAAPPTPEAAAAPATPPPPAPTETTEEEKPASEEPIAFIRAEDIGAKPAGEAPKEDPGVA